MGPVHIWVKLMGVAALCGGGIAVWMTQQQGHGTSSGDQTESTKEQILDIKQLSFDIRSGWEKFCIVTKKMF